MKRAPEPTADPVAQSIGRFVKRGALVRFHLHERATSRARIDIERCAARQLLASVGGHLDGVRDADGLLRTFGHARSALNAGAARQGDDLPVRTSRCRLDGACRTRAGALVAGRASAEIDHREPERRGYAERFGFGDHPGLETVDENAEHVCALSSGRFRNMKG